MERPPFWKIPQEFLEQEKQAKCQVFLGSPSEGALQRGDVVLRINDREANRITHQEAHDVIVSSNKNLALVVHRLTGVDSSPATTPTTSSTMGTSHPLAKTTCSAFEPKPAGFFRASSPATPSTLPTTKMTSEYRPERCEPQILSDYERQEYFYDQQQEQQKIQHQPYRTVQLVFPQAKPRHDIPMGSYLRHVHDPTWKKTYLPSSRMQDALVSKVYETKKGTGISSASISPGRTPTPDSETGVSNFDPKVVHHQYNTPINFYSKQTMTDALQGQTGLQPGQSSPQPGSKIRKSVDITMSPTYMLLQEEEISRPKEQKPIRTQHYANSNPKSHRINAFGMPKDKILQSGSFNTLMTSLVTGQSDF
ncbi:uncharacterized protein LOC106467195 isoform X2 [Limulus polyphemus]|uniref:Uncharacterized protein LOC106467195 isoform X2 n=1 Tax=Limulus polyphemus TaxID=6850 RepID=A0ABM1T572_LIMPO|nr:uncharacterized protein LOC106467195 isoform X2 [Limulus polyphemus]